MTNTAPKPLIISGFSSQALARDIAECLDAEIVGIDRKMFDDGEIRVGIEENIRGRPIVVIASASGDPNRVEKETRLLLKATKKNGAASITLLLPYMTYGRSDANFGSRTTPALIDTIEGYRDFCDNVIVADPHNQNLTKSTFEAAQNVKSCDTVHLAYSFATQLNSLFDQRIISRKNILFTHADAGSRTRITESFRAALYRTASINLNPEKKNEWAQADADRSHTTGEKDIKIDNDFTDKDVVLFEDMIASGGTACKIAKKLKERGARSVILFATSGLFTPSKNATKTSIIDKINNSELDAVFITDTYDYHKTHPSISRAIEKSPIIHVIKTGPFLASLVNAIHMQVTSDMDRDENSISAILRGTHPSQKNGNSLAKPTPLKQGSPLLTLG
ncbi:MAG: ribose-phosphate diphosphokinase [Alphaproteobacteria bacterium]|nr:ribose-phosphate diphosphokinase [Alphaproteobacteria bacterium]